MCTLHKLPQETTPNNRTIAEVYFLMRFPGFAKIDNGAGLTFWVSP